MSFKHIDLFSGIGGFALACKWNNIETIMFCDNDKFCAKVLNKNFPGVPIVNDIRNVDEIREIVTNTNATGQSNRNGQRGWSETQAREGKRSTSRCDSVSEETIILIGGFPCQPFSNAGRKRGSTDSRYLWNETFAVIEAIKPDWIVLENVFGIFNMVFPDSAVGVASQATLFGVENEEIADYNTITGRIESDLRKTGYETVWLVIPACAVNAPHRRDRVWIVANLTADTQHDGSTRTEGQGKDTGIQQKEQTWQKLCNVQSEGTCGIRNDGTGDEDAPNTNTEGLQEQEPNGRTNRELHKETSSRFIHSDNWSENWYEVATRLCGISHGIPNELYELETSNRVDRLKALGNSIVPQVAYEIIKNIVETENA